MSLLEVLKQSSYRSITAVSKQRNLLTYFSAPCVFETNESDCMPAVQCAQVCCRAMTSSQAPLKFRTDLDSRPDELLNE